MAARFYLGLAAALLAASLFWGCATKMKSTQFAEPNELPVRAEMPDPLTMLNGQKVRSRAEWFNDRRPELKALFQHYMYGTVPAKPAAMDAKVVHEYPDFLGGLATLKLIAVETGTGSAPKIDLMLVLPNTGGKVPVFLAMNFCGNHALTEDPRVPLARGWMYDHCKGCSNNVAVESARGGQAADWPLEEIVKRGYGLAAFCSSDVDSDRPDVSDGVYKWMAASGDSVGNNPTNRGTIAGWAWGFHRCIDYLVTDQRVDSKRIASVGHSRNGKTALLAAAFDERIALAIPHQAGCGGSAPSRGKTGESVQRINTSFPHWFNGSFKMFNADPTRLPFDQNCLVALCAPRPVLFSNAQEDQWANPSGQFEVLRSADKVYRFLGEEGLEAKEMPLLRHLVPSRLGYYIREGKHSMTADDWKVFMEYADHFLKKAG